MSKSLIHSLESHRRDIVEKWYSNQFDEKLTRKYGVRGLESNDRSWVRPRFLLPLLNLLIEYLRTGEERYLVVYLDERLRYAPHLSPPDERVEFFQNILLADEAALLNVAEEGDRYALQKALSGIHAPLISKSSKSKTSVHLLCLGDCLMNEIRVFLSYRAYKMEIPLDIRILYFSALLNRSLSIKDVLDYVEINKVDLIAMSFLSFTGIPAYMTLMREVDYLSQYELEKRVASLISLIFEFIDNLRKHMSMPFLIHDACGLPLTVIRSRIPFIPAISSCRLKVLSLINQALRDMVNTQPKCSILSETEIVEKNGYRTCSKSLISQRIVGKGFFHTSIFGSKMTDQYIPVLKAYHTLYKTKLLLVDFDNTLWNGVMADGAVEHYIDKQQLLRRLKEVGILLVALSKNTLENIRWDEMKIKQEDFVLLKINWNMKAQSVQEIAIELNLGMDSFVLLDDNPVELELIRNACPKVICLDSRTEETWSMLEWLFLFPNTQETEESRGRTEMYRTQSERKKHTTSEIDYPVMMQSLNLCMNFGKANSKDLLRLSELINRTNQFNTTTLRYSKYDLDQLLNNKNFYIYVADLEDKFGKLGLVTASIVNRQDDRIVIELFVMSCRAMGFGLENLMLRKLVESEIVENKKLIGRFIPSDRNGPASTFFKNNGFEPLTETEWFLPSIDLMPLAPDWFTVYSRT
jgi:FkbH-like protein